MKLLVLWLVLLAGSTNVFTQTTPQVTVKPLTIGDTVPDIEFTNIINYHSKTARLSDFNGKNIIIDFWSTWCGACIKLFPELAQLQKDFKDSLTIIAVTTQPKELIKSFLLRNKIGKSITFLIATDDSIMHKTFPHTSIPHEVWIDRGKVVKAITSDSYITPDNIKYFISGGSLKFKQKKDNNAFDYDKSIGENNLKEYNDLLIREFKLYKYLNGVHTSQRIYNTGEKTHVSYLNYPVLLLYEMASGGKLPYFNRQTILELPDKQNYVQGTQNFDEWLSSTAVCYEAVFTGSTSDEYIKNCLMNDLNTTLGLYGRIEKREVNVLNLIYRSDGIKNAISKNNEPVIDWVNDQPLKLIINQPVSVLIDLLNNSPVGIETPTLFVDSTNLTRNINIQLELSNSNDIQVLKKALSVYGFDLIYTRKEMEIFVLSKALH